MRQIGLSNVVFWESVGDSVAMGVVLLSVFDEGGVLGGGLCVGGCVDWCLWRVGLCVV